MPTPPPPPRYYRINKESVIETDEVNRHVRINSEQRLLAVSRVSVRTYHCASDWTDLRENSYGGGDFYGSLSINSKFL